MKRMIAVLLSLFLLLSLVACGNESSAPKQQTTPVHLSEENESTVTDNILPPETSKAESTATSETTYGSSSTEKQDSESTDSTLVLNLENVTTLDDLEDYIEENVESVINFLYSQWESLSAETDDYKKYCDNSEKVTDFYQTILTSTEQLCIRLKEYSLLFTGRPPQKTATRD